MQSILQNYFVERQIFANSIENVYFASIGHLCKASLGICRIEFFSGFKCVKVQTHDFERNMFCLLLAAKTAIGSLIRSTS